MCFAGSILSLRPSLGCRVDASYFKGGRFRSVAEACWGGNGRIISQLSRCCRFFFEDYSPLRRSEYGRGSGWSVLQLCFVALLNDADILREAVFVFHGGNLCWLWELSLSCGLSIIGTYHELNAFMWVNHL